MVDRATCGCVCQDGYYRNANDACVLPCNANATGTGDACAAGDYTGPPEDTYENGACGMTANSCPGGMEDTSPSDDPPVAGVCGSAANTCNPGTPTAKSETDSGYLWTCEGTDGAELFCDQPPSGCEGEILRWSVDDLYGCSAHFGPTEANQFTPHLDMVTATDSAPQHTGSATFTCNDGEWTGPTDATCVCGPQCGCVAAGGTWVGALPERERTCEGNDGCTGHTHSCTTPADPAGGYQSCTYKKHKGGFSCTSHSHATCDPYPATTAHCHIDLSDLCPICFPP